MLEGTNTLPASSPTLFVLSYDAITFEHLGGEETIITVSGHRVNPRDNPAGILGIFLSKTRAKNVGERWLYNEFDGVLNAPVPYEWDDEVDAPPGSWIRTGNEHCGWVDDVYSIIDLGRTDRYDFPVALSVKVEAWNVDEEEESEGVQMDEELAGFAASAA